MKKACLTVQTDGSIGGGQRMLIFTRTHENKNEQHSNAPRFLTKCLCSLHFGCQLDWFYTKINIQNSARTQGWHKQVHLLNCLSRHRISPSRKQSTGSWYTTVQNVPVPNCPVQVSPLSLVTLKSPMDEFFHSITFSRGVVLQLFCSTWAWRFLLRTVMDFSYSQPPFAPKWQNIPFAKTTYGQGKRTAVRWKKWSAALKPSGSAVESCFPPAIGFNTEKRKTKSGQNVQLTVWWSSLSWKDNKILETLNSTFLADFTQFHSVRSSAQIGRACHRSRCVCRVNADPAVNSKLQNINSARLQKKKKSLQSLRKDSQYILI